MRLFLVLSIVAELLRWFSLAFVAPILMAAAKGEWAAAGHFAIAPALALPLGFLASKVERPERLQRGEALAVVAFTWLFIGALGAVPYVFEGLSFVDAMFESVSGFTTTGATILSDFSAYGDAFFLWRAMTQWFGGLGVIALFVVVLPRLGIAGRQLFFAEASGAPSEAVSPQIRKTAARLWVVYTGLTVLLVGLLWLSGMSVLDALMHSLTTMAAGGFSPHPQSIAGYENPTAEWILSVFMILAGTSFTLQYKVYTGRLLGFFRDGEFMFYFAFAAGAALIMAITIGPPSLETLRLGAFQSASIISSTGFASTDYNLWPDAARAAIMIVMIVGGCAGSAAGGPKAIRHLLVSRHVANEIRRLIHPRAVLPVRYRDRIVPPEIMRSVFTLAALYVSGYFVLGAVLVMLGTDLVQGFTAAIACLGNIGPAFGQAGPMGSYAHFPDLEKALLTAAMWIGRLEIVTVLGLLHPDVWRNISLRRPG